MTTDVNLIADHFQAYLLVEIGLDNACEVDRRNATPEYAGACASHDFCDANMPMAAAFEAVTGREPDVASQADADLWNAAWNIAKARGFATVE